MDQSAIVNAIREAWREKGTCTDCESESFNRQQGLQVENKEGIGWEYWCLRGWAYIQGSRLLLTASHDALRVIFFFVPFEIYYILRDRTEKDVFSSKRYRPPYLVLQGKELGLVSTHGL